MPSPEHRGGGPRKEQEPLPGYCRAALFPDEELSGQVYAEVQHAIFETTCDLSVYRFHLNQLWHVAALGQPPPQELDQQIETILSAGEPTELPVPVLSTLNARRQQQIKKGPWVEGHYHGGKGKRRGKR